MVNVHQVCRLCMAQIGVHGIDCTTFADIRNAIETLYQLEIKPDDECSKRVCEKCAALVVDFFVHQRTVNETQQKIKQCIDLQKQINNSRVAIKAETQNGAGSSAAKGGVPDSNRTNSTQQNGADRAESVATRSADGGGTQEKRAKNADKDTTPNRIGSAKVIETPNRAKNADMEKMEKRNGNVNTDDTQNQAKKADPVNGESSRPSRYTRSSSREPIEATKKRRRHTMHDSSEQTDSQRIKRSKSSRKSLRSDEGNADANKVTNESPPAATTHSQRIQQKSKSPSITPKAKRNKRLFDPLPSTSGQTTMLKYLSKPSCSKCDAEIRTLEESRFHGKCHEKKRCALCKKPVKTKDDIEHHVFSCLLTSGRLTTYEMLSYMKPLSVKLDRAAARVIKKEKAEPTKAANRARNANVEGSDMDSEVVRPTRRLNCSKPIIVDSSSEEETRDTDTDTASGTAAKQTVNVVGDTNAAASETVVTGAEMPSHKKKVAESTLQRQEKCALQFGRNTSLAVTWNRLATNNRLFTTQTSFPRMANRYIAIESMPIIPNLKELEKMRLKMAARTRNVPTDTDKETSARKLSAVRRYSSTRMSVSDGDRNRVPVCDGERLVKHLNAVVLFPASFDANESPRNQPSQSKDRRKSVHGISIGTAVFNRNDKNGPSTIQIPVVARSAAVSSAYAPIAPPPPPPQLSQPKQVAPSNGPNNTIVMQSSAAPPSYQRPNVFYINSGVAPTTSAAALAATASSSQSTTMTTTAALAPSSQPPPLVPTRPPPSAPKNSVKVLSVTELNSRAVQINNNENRPAQNQISHVNGVKMKYVPIAPKAPSQPPPQEPPTNTDEENVNPIHVTLIKRQGNELELTLTQGGQRKSYDTLTESQRHEVQKSLLANSVWKQMLHHVKLGSPSQHTLDLFRLLLPPVEQQYFFTTFYAAKQQQQNSHNLMK